MNRNRTTHQSTRVSNYLQVVWCVTDFKIIFQLDPITKKPVKSIEQQERLIKLRVNITLKGLAFNSFVTGYSF